MDEQNNAVVEEAVETKPVKKQRDKYELHEILWIVAIIAAVVSFLFVLISQNALNGAGYYAFQKFGMEKPLKFQWLTASLASYIAGGAAIISLGTGIARNFLRKNKTVMSYLPGIVVTILSAIAFAAAYLADK